jgi:hypothetical protein
VLVGRRFTASTDRLLLRLGCCEEGHTEGAEPADQLTCRTGGQCRQESTPAAQTGQLRVVVDSATSWANVWGRRRRRGAAGLAGSESSDELERFGRTVTASLSTWRKHDGKHSLSVGPGDGDGGRTSVVAINKQREFAMLDRLAGREPSRGSTLRKPHCCLPACTAHLGGLKAISRVQ